MPKFHVLIHSLLLATSPSLFAHPQGEPSVMEPVYDQENPYTLSHLTYDDILRLLQDIESEKIKDYSEDKLERISHFIAFLAKQGMLPGEYVTNADLGNKKRLSLEPLSS